MKSILFLSFLVVFVISCNSPQKDTEETSLSLGLQAPDLFSDTSSYPRIYEYNNGSIELNGTSADPQSVKRKIQEVSEKGTIVLYSSESPAEHPPKSGIVADLFKKYGVNVRTYTDKTFTKSYY
jgi:hypothetical protein